MGWCESRVKVFAQSVARVAQLALLPISQRRTQRLLLGALLALPTALAQAAAWLPAELPLTLEFCRADLSADERAALLAGAENNCFKPQARNDVLSLSGARVGWFRIRMQGPGQSGVLAIRELSNRRIEAYTPDLVAGTPLVAHPEIGWAAGVVWTWPTDRRMALLRVTGTGFQPMAMTWQSDAAWARFSAERVRFASAAHALTAAMIVLTLCFWLRLRDPTYLLFSAFLLFQELFFLFTTGEGLAWPLVDRFTQLGLRWSWFCLMVANALRVEFAVRFCALARYVSWGPPLMRATTLVFLSLAVLTLVPVVPITPLGFFGNIMIMATVVMHFWLLGLACWRGSRYAGYYLIALGATYVFAIVRGIQLLGGYPYIGWAEQGLMLSMALGPLILTIGLADLALSYRRERDAALLRAMIDPLTGVRNRAAGREVLASEIAAARAGAAALTVAYLDLDHFKRINDSHGHAFGDACLRFAASRIGRELGVSDVLLRYGGEEFVIVLPDCPLPHAREVCDRVRAAVEADGRSIDGRIVNVTLSIGLAAFAPGDDADALLSRADAALYRAKAAGRNRVEVALSSAVDPFGASVLA